MNGEVLFELKKLNKYYSSGEVETHALKDVDLTIRKGEFISIIGKSGSGKSTLLNILSGIDGASSGKVFFKGKDITDYSEKQYSVWRGENLGIVFQFFQLMPTLTVRENVILPMEFVGRYSQKAADKSSYGRKADELLKNVGIERLAAKYPSELSGGEQQRTAIARAMANDPEIIVADEPTGNLDTQTTEQIMSLFISLVAAGKTIVMVTHNNDIAQRSGRIVTISDGRIVSDTGEEELL